MKPSVSGGEEWSSRTNTNVRKEHFGVGKEGRKACLESRKDWIQKKLYWLYIKIKLYSLFFCFFWMQMELEIETCLISQSYWSAQLLMLLCILHQWWLYCTIFQRCPRLLLVVQFPTFVPMCSFSWHVSSCTHTHTHDMGLCFMYICEGIYIMYMGSCFICEMIFWNHALYFL